MTIYIIRCLHTTNIQVDVENGATVLKIHPASPPGTSDRDAFMLTCPGRALVYVPVKMGDYIAVILWNDNRPPPNNVPACIIRHILSAPDAVIELVDIRPVDLSTLSPTI